MRPLSSFALGLGLLVAAAPAQQVRIPGPILRDTPKSLLQKFDASVGQAQNLLLPRRVPQTFVMRVYLGKRTWALDLYKHDMRAPNFKAYAFDGQLREIAATPTTTFRGQVRGAHNSNVAASIVDGQLSAMIVIDDKTWNVEPVTNVDPKADPSLHVALDTSSIRLRGVSCGTKPLNVNAQVRGGNNVGPAALKLAEIGIDCDIDYYVKYGSSTTNVQNQVNRVMNAVDVIYKRDVTITYLITTIIVRTSRVYSGSISSRLGQFRSRWNSYHYNIKRDLAHLFTGQGNFSGVIGVAYLRVVCDLNNAYGTSKAFSSSTTTNAGLVSHECGHNWAAGHCDSCGNDCKIMCSGLGGCGRSITSFGTCSKNVIVPFKNSRSCLSNPSPPSLTSATPATVPALNGGTITLNGANLDTITTVHYGTKNLTKFLIVSSSKVTFDAGTATALGRVTIQVSNGQGRSNGVSVNVTETKPPRIQTNTFGFATFPHTWPFGGPPASAWLFVLSPNATTFMYGPYHILTNLIPIMSGPTNGAGIGGLTIPIPKSAQGLRVWSQAAFVNSAAVSATNIASVVFL